MGLHRNIEEVHMPETTPPTQRGVPAGTTPTTKVGVAQHFLLSVFEMKWWLGEGLSIGERASLLRLLFKCRDAYDQGLLLTKKDAMKAIGVENQVTSLRYVQLATDMEMLTVARSTLDERVHYLVPTLKGLMTLQTVCDAIIAGVEFAADALEKGAFNWPEITTLSERNLIPVLMKVASSTSRIEELAPWKEFEMASLYRGPDPWALGVTVQRKLEQEAAQYEEVLRHAEYNGGALYRLVVARYRLGDFDGVIEACEKLLQPPFVLAEGLDERVHGIFLSALRQVKHFEKAIEYADKFIANNPTRVDYLWARGESFRSIGNYDRAIGDFTSAIELEPSTWLFLSRALSFGGSGRFKEVAADVERARELHAADKNGKDAEAIGKWIEEIDKLVAEGKDLMARERRAGKRKTPKRQRVRSSREADRSSKTGPR